MNSIDSYYKLTAKEKTDISTQAQQIIKNIRLGKDSNFYGPPLSENEEERLLIAIQTAMEMNKQKAKKKFTPKKYRK